MCLIRLLLVFLLLAVFAGCSRRSDTTTMHLHNYPMINGQDCPGTYTRDGYDPHIIKLRASAVNMRPVDYLHKMNYKRWKQIISTPHVGLSDD